MEIFHRTIFVSLFCTTFSAPQGPEINDQFQITDPVTESPVQTQPQVVEEVVAPENAKTAEQTTVVPEEKANDSHEQDLSLSQVSFSFRIYKFISEPIFKVVSAPKVNAVLRNIGTCVVNGAMELFSYYLPAPFMPLIASAAGLVIPFEPVVMLKEKMPVTSYRRAFQTAMSSFLRTFDKYKVEEDFDPYMTRRFNRRFVGDDGKKQEKEEIADVE
ncbi:uncharacterized protein LOC113505179 isoform X2 [Trichoplusia ni]|uniref:Uncharacterized protein LOC113505179 isoform X2 n=1 Tax=Trichoplusia ni TaxID=7111 RepID=A0A7E5WTS6_TRINI|nr:uncharacterized protein LOC113505179 isoform X2 [Trichoplusia ni]